MAKVKLLDPSDEKRRLDRYELIGELATGGMATVFLARLAGAGGFQRFVAIKRLHPHLATEDEFIDMFLDEARLAAGIHHPHVVPILEVGQSDSGYYLVMEYIEGDTLARIVARSLSQGRPVPRPILFRIIIDTLAGLQAAHELADDHGQLVHLVHRDCSPQNILVGVDGCSRITDFGVARASSRLSNTRADRVKGKLAYMSPEQTQGEAGIDRRSDLFSMGVILWEVLASRRLFKADSDAHTMRKVMLEPIPRISTVEPGIPRGIDDIAARALERDVRRRFQTAQEMADAIERAAREAEGGSERAVATAREVAGYVQMALGQDIAAQRECVRAWLAQSESSMPAARPMMRSGIPDVTFKVPLARPPAAAPAPLPSPRRVIAMPPDPAREARAEVATLDAASAPAAMTAARGAPAITMQQARAAAEALKAEADPDDENETLLMDRDAPLRALAALRSQAAAAKAPAQTLDKGVIAPVDFQDPTLAATAVQQHPSAQGRAGKIAIVSVLVLAAGAALAWFTLSRPSPAPEGADHAATSAAPASPSATLPSATPPIASAAPPAATPSAAPSPSPSAAPAASSAASPPASSAPSAGAAQGGGKVGHPGGKATHPGTGKPASPAPGEDMANPYR